jgi:hypothetical protein
MTTTGRRMNVTEHRGWMETNLCLLTATNYCIPSTLLGIWWRRRGVPAPSDISQAI